MIDLTDQNRAEQVVRRSETYLAEAQRLTHTGSWAWNPVAQKAIYWSDEMFRIFGLDSESGPPNFEDFIPLIHPEDRDRHIQRVKKALREKVDFAEDFRAVLRDGTVKHIQVIGRPVLNESGEVVEYVGTSVDVTERNRAEDELRRQTDRLQLLLNLTNRITSNLERREVLRAIAANIREVMQCDAAVISLLDQETGKHRLYALDFPGGKGFVREETLISRTKNDRPQRALETRKPVIVNIGESSDLNREALELATAEGVKTTCFIPLVTQGRSVGVLAISRVTEGSFTPEDVGFLSQAAGQIASAVENALAYREISQLKDQLAQEKLYLEDEIRSEMNSSEILGKSPALRRVLKRVVGELLFCFRVTM